MPNEFITFERKQKYGAPPGRCIYCGSDGTPNGLRDEHIIAFSLGMEAYLPEASCTDCEKITSYLDGYAGRQIFGPLRSFMRIQSRRGEIDLGDHPVVFTTERGSETRMVPRSELPTFLILPVLPAAGLFEDREPAPIQAGQPWIWYVKDFDEKMKRLQKPGDQRAELVISYNSYPFARMLAKVAHTFAVAHLGLDSFKPFLPDFILGKAEEIGGYVVGAAAPPTESLPISPGKQTLRHKMELTLMGSVGKPTVVAMTIRLFPFTGSPTYWVIVGEARAHAIAQLTDAGGAITPEPTASQTAVERSK